MSFGGMSARPAFPLLPAALLAASLAGAVATLAAIGCGYYGMYPAAGAVAALAEAALRGQAPGHEEGSAFLATYYFPPFPLLVACAHRLGLSWLFALRTASLVSGLSVLVSAAWVARALGAGRRATVLAPALVLATYPFKASLLDGRADLLAAGLSLAALAAWSRDEEARGWAAPALAAASFLTKASSLTTPLALAVWALARRRPAALARFGARFAACAAAGALLMLPAHGPGWYLNAAQALFAHASGRSSPLRGPAELLRYLGASAEIAVFSSFALALLASPRMRARPVAAYCGLSLALALYVMAGFASGFNHLVELFAAAAVSAAVWAAPRLSRPARLAAFATAIAVLGASWRDLVPALRHASAPGNVRSAVIDTVRTEPGEVLTEDALISLAAGRRPAVTDMDALRAMALDRDPRALRIVEDLARRRFALVVLNDDLEASARWYRSIRFTDLTIEPLRTRYRRAGVVDGFHLYRPGPEWPQAGGRPTP